MGRKSNSKADRAQRAASGISRSLQARHNSPSPIDLGQREEPQYASGLTFEYPTEPQHRAIGQLVLDFSQTLHALGARAAKSGQTLLRPEAPPHISYVTADEMRAIKQEISPQDLQAALDTPILDGNYNLSAPYTLHVNTEKKTVDAHITKVEGLGPDSYSIDAFRQRLDLGWRTASLWRPVDAYHEIPLVGFDTLKPHFADRVTKLNQFPLVLGIGSVSLIEY